jgi:hypothetical protein
MVETAMRRARAARRRRAAAGSLTVVVLAAVISFTLLRPDSAGGPTDAPVIAQTPVPVTPTPTRAPATAVPPAPPAPLPDDVREEEVSGRALPVDVVVDDRLLTAGGQSVDLAPVGEVSEAYEVPSGWLVLSADGDEESLWYVAERARPRKLLDAVAAVAVAWAGNRVAWRDGEQVYLGTLKKNRLVTDAGTRVPAGAVPVGFVGDGLLLGRRHAEELIGSYAVWWPSLGELKGRWRAATGVYGALPDGRTVVAQLLGGKGEDRPCLALLDARADLTVRRQACDVPLTAGALGWVSPDGRWLVAERTSAESVVIDVDSVFGGDEPALAEGPRPNGPGAWTDGGTLVYGGDGYLARLRLDRAARGDPDAIERITVQGGDRGPVLAVPRLG